jgi:hypothetical protein
MPVSRRRHDAAIRAKDARIEQLVAEVEAANVEARATATANRRIAGELSACKDVLASHIVAAGHPSTVLHDVKVFATAMQQALADAGVDIRLELARLEGAEL